MIKEKSIAFTGHRFVPYMQTNLLKNKVRNTIIENYESGFRVFYCGMAVGFDMLAAEILLELKKELKGITLVAVVPFRGQDFRFNDDDKNRYKQILQKADNILVLTERYYKGCLLRRNDFMLEHSSKLIAYYNGEKKGGTFYTFIRAERKGMPIVNLY